MCLRPIFLSEWQMDRIHGIDNLKRFSLYFIIVVDSIVLEWLSGQCWSQWNHEVSGLNHVKL